MKAKTYNAPTISAGTITRTAVLLLALTNQILSACGKPVLPIESATVEQLVTAGITTVAALISWWNNTRSPPPQSRRTSTWRTRRARSTSKVATLLSRSGGRPQGRTA